MPRQPRLDLVDLALVTAGMLSLSIRARAGASRRELKKLARAFVTLVVDGGIQDGEM